MEGIGSETKPPGQLPDRESLCSCRHERRGSASIIPSAGGDASKNRGAVDEKNLPDGFAVEPTRKAL